MTSDLLLTYDLGTTRLKTAVFTIDGDLVGAEARRHQEHRDGVRLWQDADAWWRDAVGLTRTLLDRLAVDPVRLRALSLTGRAGAGVFADAAGRVLVHPWSDGRHRETLARLNPDRQFATYGATLVAKYRWLKDHEPATAARIRHAFFGKDFLLFRLTSAHRTDPSSGPDGLAWDAELTARAEVPATHLPTPGLPWEVAGETTANAARALGIPPGLPVAIGAHDGISANVGAGATRPGDYALTLGTHAVVRAISDRAPDGARRFYGLPPDRHVIGGNALWGGRAADWFVDLCRDGPEPSGLATLDEAAAAVVPGADGAIFLPYLGGRSAPRTDLAQRAAFAGLHLGHGRAHLFRAVLEGVAFALAEILDQVEGWCGRAERLRLTGGGTGSAVWREILATVLDRPLEYSDTAAETRGAAIFAAVALGLHADFDAAADVMARSWRRLDPDADRAARYRELYRRWRAAHGVLGSSRRDRSIARD